MWKRASPPPCLTTKQKESCRPLRLKASELNHWKIEIGSEKRYLFERMNDNIEFIMKLWTFVLHIWVGATNATNCAVPVNFVYFFVSAFSTVYLVFWKPTEQFRFSVVGRQSNISTSSSPCCPPEQWNFVSFFVGFGLNVKNRTLIGKNRNDFFYIESKK